MTNQEKLKSILAKTKKDGDCLIWLGSILRRPSSVKSSWKYPHIDFRSKRWRGNRLVYFLANDELPGGRLVLHRCGNSLCVNPAHLYLGTAKQNALDTLNHGHNVKRNKTHCPWGHPYSGKNLRLTKHGHRGCRSCEWHKKRKDTDRFKLIYEEIPE